MEGDFSVFSGQHHFCPWLGIRAVLCPRWYTQELLPRVFLLSQEIENQNCACRGAVKPVSRYRARVLQLTEACAPRAVLETKATVTRSSCTAPREWPPLAQLEKARGQQQRSSTAKYKVNQLLSYWGKKRKTFPIARVTWDLSSSTWCL